jgi:membrane protease YdiL (CAAX protease family)
MNEENPPPREEMPALLSTKPSPPVLDYDRVDEDEGLLHPEITGPVPPVHPGRIEASLEVLVFLFLILPSMVLSFFSGGPEASVSFVFLGVSTILRDLSLVCLILFFTWRNGEPVRRLGWRYKGLDRELLLGFVLYVPFVFVIGAIAQLFSAAGLSAPAEPGPSFFKVGGEWELALAVVMVIVVAISEETIFRGYLILRLQTATGSTAAAVLLSAALFAVGHGYEGSLGVATVGVMGLVFSLIYLWRRSLVAPIVLHFLQDFIAIVLSPYLQ